MANRTAAQLHRVTRVARKKARRQLQAWRTRGLSQAEQVAAERRLRGREEAERLARADYVVVSFGKSGRTWLRLMVSRLLQVRYGLPEGELINFDNFHMMNSAIPKICFTHDTYIGDYTRQPGSKRPYFQKPVIFLARDPRDTAVSQFFQWKFRMKPHKMGLNNYPEKDEELTLFQFVMGDDHFGGMRSVIDYLNLWAQESENIERFHLARYESLRASPEEELRKVMSFLGFEATKAELIAAVEHASFDNMKKMEEKGTYASGRMRARDSSNPESYKVRRAQVGGYRDYFSDAQVAAIDRKLAESLDPSFGYADFQNASVR